MNRTRLPGLAAAAVTLSLVVAGCTSTPDPTPSPPTGGSSPAATNGPPTSPEPTPTITFDPYAESELERNYESDLAVLNEVNWVEKNGGYPSLEFYPPLFVTGPVARLYEDGDGEQVKEGDTVTFDYAMFAGDNGELSYSTFDRGTPETITVQSTGMSQTLAEVMIGSHVGAKIIFATVDSSGAKASDFLYAQFMTMVVRSTRSPLERATGQVVKPPAWLPTVTLADNGRPSITLPIPAAAPRELISQLLIRGEGPVLEPEQMAIVKFTAWVWDGTEFDSTWDDNASMSWPMTQDLTMPGLQEGLIGQRVGSQVLLIIPPDLAFGDVAMVGAPPGSTMVYVVDLVDAQ